MPNTFEVKDTSKVDAQGLAKLIKEVDRPTWTRIRDGLGVDTRPQAIRAVAEDPEAASLVAGILQELRTGEAEPVKPVTDKALGGPVPEPAPAATRRAARKARLDISSF